MSLRASLCAAGMVACGLVLLIAVIPSGGASACREPNR